MLAGSGACCQGPRGQGGSADLGQARQLHRGRRHQVHRHRLRLLLAQGRYVILWPCVHALPRAHTTFLRWWTVATVLNVLAPPVGLPGSVPQGPRHVSEDPRVEEAHRVRHPRARAWRRARGHALQVPSEATACHICQCDQQRSAHHHHYGGGVVCDCSATTG